jgi:hypothetical protein
MALIGNHSILNKSYQRTYGGTATAATFHNNNKSSLMASSILRSRAQLQFKKASIPGTGYGPGSAFMMPMTGGELGGQRIDGVATVTASALSALIAELDSIAGVATVTGSANAVGLIELEASSAGVASVTADTLVTSSLSGSTAGIATVLANLGAVIPCEASSAGVASSSVNLKGTGRLNGIISIGASGYLSNDDVERLSEAVWDVITADHATAGTTGKALADAGGAGNPWSADTSTNNDPGTFGEKVQKLLTTAKYLGTK